MTLTPGQYQILTMFNKSDYCNLKSEVKDLRKNY